MFCYQRLSDYQIHISDFVLNSHKRVNREIIIMSDWNKIVFA